jgi:hypothetical protein
VELDMKRIEVYAVGILLALVPAMFGLWGNASFSRAVPVRVPVQARATAANATPDTRALVAADHAGRTPVERHHARHGADDPATHDVGDDHGGNRSGASSDDRSGTSGRSGSGTSGGSGSGASGGRGGADDPATHDVGDDRGGATTGASGTSGGGGADDTSGQHSGGGSGSGSGTSGTSGSGGGKGSGGGSDD